MLNRLRIALAAIIMALAAMSAADSASAQVSRDGPKVIEARAVDAASVVDAPEFGFDVSAQRRP